MRHTLITLTTASLLVLAACENLSEDENAILGGVAGATVGVLTADALGANSNWKIIAALGGAAAGVLVARNAQTNECAYANGDGTYRTAPCS
jgi:uncharacterized protein YcfJ